jgi:hypothetical protein
VSGLLEEAAMTAATDDGSGRTDGRSRNGLAAPDYGTLRPARQFTSAEIRGRGVSPVGTMPRKRPSGETTYRSKVGDGSIGPLNTARAMDGSIDGENVTDKRWNCCPGYLPASR